MLMARTLTYRVAHGDSEILIRTPQKGNVVDNAMGAS